MGTVASYERDGGVGIIRIDDGKANVMSVPTMSAINSALDQAEADGVVVVIEGREGLFSAGFDLGVFKQGPGPAGEMLRAGGTLVARILSFPAPVIAACTGHAIAMGSFLLLSSDLRIGASGAFRIGMNEVAIGLAVPYFALEVARQRLPVSVLSRAALLAEMVGPEEAARMGFLDRVVPSDQVVPAALEAARAFSELDMAAHRETKVRLRGATAEAVRQATVDEFGALA
ncbi:MAG: crotonase/enoyl-CoA hydratase family protein [Myxococcota bacterium]